ncbi:GPI biosynthesis protein family Pig-F-domain-containing protein [Scheffersomyces amazonensis]|uniref:GPI biosynthesis protein family Pig-F-domain-containing protein n=1 Tax=Scheffersomyces amazonensis TaxID=1078765 RepID=UPI00315CB5C2
MAKTKSERKSVSFESREDQGNDSDINGEDGSGIKKDEDTLKKEKEEDEAIRGSIPKLNNSLLTIPYHNLLILGGMFYYGLTENVNEVLLNGLFSLIPIQIGYNYILYNNIKIKKKKNDNTNVPLLIIGSVIISLILAFPLFVFIILFGAPLINYITQTILLSFHLSIILFNPLLIYFKFDINNLLVIFKANKIYRLIFSHSVLSSSLAIVVGTWLGVVPIPLDWDRPWQQWPITLLAGGYIGSVVGGIISLVLS